MQNNNLNSRFNSREDAGLFYLIKIVWKNKWLLVLILLIFAVLGVIFNYSYPYINKKTPSVTINILISNLTQFNNILVDNNPNYKNTFLMGDPTRIVIDKLNRILASTNNYEEWSKKSKSLSKHLSQYNATTLRISEFFENITVSFSSTDLLNSIISYLSHSTQVLSNQINATLKKARKVLEEKINTEQNKIDEKYKLRIMDIEIDIINRTVQLEGAKEELDFIEKNMAKEAHDSFSLTLRILNLTNTIKINKLIIQNLNKRKDKYLSLENVYNQDLVILKEELVDLINNQLSINIKPVRIGEKSVHENTFSKNYSLIVSLLSFIVTGFVLGIIFLHYKEEYIKNHNTMKRRNKI